MTLDKKIIGTGFIIMIGLGLHLAGVTRPFLGNFAQHQTDYATVVSNFLEKGIRPELPLMKFVTEGKERLFLGDLPLTMTLAAFLCKLTRFSIEACGRSLSAISFLLSIYPFYGLARLFTASKTAAFWAFLFYLFSPLTIVYGQSFLLEMPSLFFLISSMYLLFLYQERGKLSFLFFSAFSAAIAVALRIYYIFFLIGVAFLFFSKYKYEIFKKRQLYLYFLVVISLVSAWQAYAYILSKRLGTATSLQDNLIVFNITRNFPDPILLKLETYKIWLDNMINKLVTPVGMVMALIGMFILQHRKAKVFTIAFISGFLLLFIAAPRKMYEFDYYYLPLVPILCILAGAGLEGIIKKTSNSAAFKFCIASFLIMLSLRYAVAPAFFTPKEDKNVLKAAEYVRSIVPKTSMVIASHGTSTSFLYYCDRIGWAFPTDEIISTAVRFPQDTAGTAVERLERFRKQGAEFFAITDKENLEANKNLSDHLVRHYAMIMDKDDILIFDLRKFRE